MTDFLPGWPCAPAASNAPSVADLLSAPTGDDLLPQVLALTPRGPAWGTDEAGDGSGASPMMRKVWLAISKWASANHVTDFMLALQALPSEITYSLGDWEAELGLPDPCGGTHPGDAARKAAVRARFASIGGQSPGYYKCLAASLGYAVCKIEEFRSARIGNRIGDRLNGVAWDFTWRIHSTPVVVSYSRIGSRIGDRLATWGNAELECAIRRAAPAHTTVLFAYDCSPYSLDDDFMPFADDDGTLLTET
jgi:uncharacterized protein YmfQ (DUF2313 family)